MDEDVRTKVFVEPDLEPLIPGFLANRAADMRNMVMALANSDYETIRITGHTLKGVGGGYGFHEITRIGKLIEEAAKEKNTSEIELLISCLDRYLHKVDIVFQQS